MTDDLDEADDFISNNNNVPSSNTVVSTPAMSYSKHERTYEKIDYDTGHVLIVRTHRKKQNVLTNGK